MVIQAFQAGDLSPGKPVRGTNYWGKETEAFIKKEEGPLPKGLGETWRGKRRLRELKKRGGGDTKNKGGGRRQLGGAK